MAGLKRSDIDATLRQGVFYCVAVWMCDDDNACLADLESRADKIADHLGQESIALIELHYVVRTLDAGPISRFPFD